MSELRHVKLDTMISIKEWYMKQNVQEKLQTITMVTCNPSVFRMGFFESIPNIENLGIYCSTLLYINEVVDLRRLHKLQTLRCKSDLNRGGFGLLRTLRFPPSLRKLVLSRCMIFPSVLTTLCALPNLEVLKLTKCEFENEEFAGAEDDVFGSLQFLLLDELNNMVRWRADETNFPRLRELVIIDCLVIEGIPSGIGDISMLQDIGLYNCTPCVEASAKEIQKVQQSEFDNYHLQLTISHS